MCACVCASVCLRGGKRKRLRETEKDRKAENNKMKQSI